MDQTTEHTLPLAKAVTVGGMEREQLIAEALHLFHRHEQRLSREVERDADKGLDGGGGAELGRFQLEAPEGVQEEGGGVVAVSPVRVARDDASVVDPAREMSEVDGVWMREHESLGGKELVGLWCERELAESIGVGEAVGRWAERLVRAPLVDLIGVIDALGVVRSARVWWGPSALARTRKELAYRRVDRSLPPWSSQAKPDLALPKSP